MRPVPWASCRMTLQARDFWVLCAGHISFREVSLPLYPALPTFPFTLTPFSTQPLPPCVSALSIPFLSSSLLFLSFLPLPLFCLANYFPPSPS